VVLDDQTKVDAKTAEVTQVPWSAAELARFTRLVQDSVGFDASRGDSVSVINAPFAAQDGDEIISIPFYTQPWFWDIIKQVLGVLFILVLVFGVLKPVLKNISSAGKGSAGGEHGGDVALGAMGGYGADLADDRVSIGGPQSILLPSPTEGYDAQLNAIKGLVAEDAGRVAQVVKEWINADE
jgi:flagellar M-ring protein FliF